MYGDFPARNTVCTPYIPINAWFWPIPNMECLYEWSTRNCKECVHVCLWLCVRCACVCVVFLAVKFMSVSSLCERVNMDRGEEGHTHTHTQTHTQCTHIPTYTRAHTHAHIHNHTHANAYTQGGPGRAGCCRNYSCPSRHTTKWRERGCKCGWSPPGFAVTG